MPLVIPPRAPRDTPALHLWAYGTSQALVHVVGAAGLLGPDGWSPRERWMRPQHLGAHDALLTVEHLALAAHQGISDWQPLGGWPQQP